MAGRLIERAVRRLRSLHQRKTLTIDVATAGQGAIWRPSSLSAEVRRPQSHRIGTREVSWHEHLTDDHPQPGVIELPSGWQLSGQGWPIDPEGRVLISTTWFGNESKRANPPPLQVAPTSLHGTAFSLLSDFSQVNYYHFLIDALGRFAIYEDLRGALPQIDYFICPRPFSERLRPWIDALGLPASRVILAGEDERFECDRLLVPTFPGRKRDMAAWIPQFWRARRPDLPMEGKRRIYVSRRTGVRSVKNSDDVEERLSRDGFEIVDPAKVLDAPALFSEASIVVGAHGAGLTDCIFCPPNATLVELVPSDHVFPYYYGLAGATRIKYAYLVGNSLGSRRKGAWGPSPFDFEIDVDQLLGGLKAAP